MDINQKREYLKDSLNETGWEDILFDWLDSSNFESVMKNLLEKVEVKNERFTPPITKWFEPFIKCHYENLNVLFIDNGPYHTLHSANGLAFSSNSDEPALKYLKKGIYESDLKELIDGDDIKHITHQGVLLYNAALTSEIDKYVVHSKLWNTFTTRLFDRLNTLNDDLIVVLFGKKTEKWASHFKDQKIITVEHPLKGLYTNWDHGDLFRTINKTLINLGKSPIIW